jgi:4-hydroxyisophthalate hydroxylase
MINFDVIILGGGPVGIALAIELGLNHVRTLVLEKHVHPLKMPRAQSLSARTMEFFLRWGIDNTLYDSLLLPQSFPQTGIWCSSLVGESYLETAWGDNQLDLDTSPKEGVRVPIWVTEEVLRQRLQSLPTVTFLKEHEVQHISVNSECVVIESYDKQNKIHTSHQATFLACCDGVSGPSKALLKNSYHPMSDSTQMLGTMFKSKELMDVKKVPDGIMYFIQADGALAFVGPVDLNEGLWLAQIVWNDPEKTPDEATLSTVIDKLVGQPIQKQIVDFYIWDMQVQIADFFNLENRVFWLGDSAHAFAPTGGLGLNTGFGDSQNLGWKLAAVIHKTAPTEILSTYATERHPVWISNLNFAKNNAKEFLELKNKYPPEVDVKAYTMGVADLGTRYLHSSGLTLGYGYFDSRLTQLLPEQSQEIYPFKYTPKTEPGYFLPHVKHQETTIYQHLSAIDWNLIVCGQLLDDSDKHDIHQTLGLKSLNIVEVAKHSYPHTYILIRPDWHIASLGESLSNLIGPLKEFLL